MSFDNKHFEAMKEQLPEWLLDEEDKENKKHIDEFLLLGEVAEEEYQIQRSILKACKDEPIADAPDGFFEQLPDQLWQDFQNEKSKFADLDDSSKDKSEDSPLGSGSTNIVDDNVINFTPTKINPEPSKGFSGKPQDRQSTSPVMLSVFAMAASIVFAIILWPSNQSVNPATHQNLKGFHSQLSIDDEVFSSNIFSDEQQLLGFAPSGSLGRFVSWGRQLSLLYALHQHGKRNELTNTFNQLATATNQSELSKVSDWEEKLKQLTAGLEFEAAENGGQGLLSAGIWLTNLYMAAEQPTNPLGKLEHQLTAIYEKLPKDYQNENLQHSWKALTNTISQSQNKQQLKAIQNQSLDLLKLLEL